MTDICGYASTDDTYEDGNVYCQLDKGHEGSHEAHFSWETRLEDIKHEHTFGPLPDGYKYLENRMFGPDASRPIGQCTFCGRIQWSTPNEMQKIYAKALMTRLPNLEEPNDI